MSAVARAGATAPRVGRCGGRIGRPRGGAGTSRRCTTWRAVASAAADDDLHKSIAVVLIEPQGPVNIGGVARLCQNFGFNDLRIVDARQSVFADKAHLVAQAEEAKSLGDDTRANELMEASKSAWVKSGDDDAVSEATVAPKIGRIHGETYKYSTDASAELLDGAFKVGGVENNINDCTFIIALSARSRNGTPVLSVRQAAEQAASAVKNGNKVALLFGNERTGLTNEHMRYVNATALISTGGDKSSLNLSHAVGVALHEQHVALESAGDGVGDTGGNLIGDTNGDVKAVETDATDTKKKQKASRVATVKQRVNTVSDLLSALDAVELVPPTKRPPAGFEICDVWGTRRADDRKSLERIFGVIGEDGEKEKELEAPSSSASSEGEGRRNVLASDVEVLGRLARRVVAVRGSTGDVNGINRHRSAQSSSDTDGGILDAFALSVAADFFTSENRPDQIGVRFDDLPPESQGGVQKAVSDAIGDRHVSKREMRRLLERRG